MKRVIRTVFFALMCANILIAQTAYEFVKDLSYYPDSISKLDSYISQRCKLDVHYPKDMMNVPVVIWFHGGGLSSGEKQIPEGLKEQGISVVAVNYRLHPKVEHPSYIEDAAAAVAWVFQNIVTYNGNPDSIFVSGHSAGGYLASMIGLDKKYLNEYNIDANNIAGLIPLSGHTITHFTIRKEMGIEGTQPIINQYSPLFHIRKDAPPILLVTGDRELELLGRCEENAYFWRMMKIVGHVNSKLYELDGHDHMGMVNPSIQLMINFMKNIKYESEK